MKTLNAIRNYILFLKREHGLFISLHPVCFDAILYSNQLRMFNIHTCPYCTYIKTKKATQKHCISMQKKVFEKCKTGSFCGVCYAGVKEFVYPITNGKECVAFISASGYKTDNAKSYQHKIAKQYGFNISNLKKNYDLLKSDSVSKNYIDTLIQPLCDMLELAYLKTDNIQKNEPVFAEKVANYIKEVRNQNITSTEICHKFNCSRSYMSTRFNKHYGKTIPEYITELRMEDAKALLGNSELNITEIAYCVGFADANYFSNVFKKLNNVTPSAYRKILSTKK